VIIVIIVGLAFITLLNAALFLSVIGFGRKMSQLERGVESFIIPESEGKPSHLARTAEVFADMIGRSVSATAKATFMGKQGADIRGQAAVEGDIAEDTAKQSAVGSLLTSFPTLRKSIRRNPQLLDVAMAILKQEITPQLKEYLLKEEVYVGE